jgi:hypothetical protein
VRILSRRVVLAAALAALLAALAGAAAAHGQEVLPTPPADFALEPTDECVLGSCAPTVTWESPYFVPGGFRVEVDWDVPGGAQEAFAPDAASTCGDSVAVDPECVLQGPPYPTTGVKTVALRVTGPDGIAQYASSYLEVVPQPSVEPVTRTPPRSKTRSRGLCPPFQSGVHCGPGNNRRTSGGGGKVSHKGWPAVSGIFWIVQDGRGHANGAGTPLNDEILGGHGNDRLRGGGGKDILWGDYHPTGNRAKQRDFLGGGSGADFIYTSHGVNTVRAGAGRDRIYAHWGRGTIDCGPGVDWVGVNNFAMHYKLRHCEHRVQW